MSEPSTALTTPTTLGTDLAGMGFGALAKGYTTTIEGDNQAAKRATFNLLQSQGLDPRGWVNKPIEIVHWLWQPATFLDKDTGEEITTLMTKMLLKGGEIITTHSSVVAKQLLNAVNLLGKPTDKAPYKCQLISVPIRDNKVMLTLEFPTK